MNRRKVFILLIFGLICVVFFWADQKVHKVQDQHRKFIYCSLIKQGMAREEVNEQLDLIGEFSEERYKGIPESLDLIRIQFSDERIRFITGGETIIAYEDGKVLLRYYYHSISDRYYFCDEEKLELYGNN